MWVVFFFHFCNQDFEINKGVGGRVCVTNKNVKTFIYIFYMDSKEQLYRVFSHDVTAAILVSQNNETAAMLVSQTNALGIELFSYANAFFCFSKFA